MNIHLCFLPRRINMQQAALCIYFKCFNFFSGRIVCATYRKNFYSICKKINSTKNFMHVKLIFIYWIPLILWFICDFDFGAVWTRSKNIFEILSNLHIRLNQCQRKDFFLVFSHLVTLFPSNAIKGIDLHQNIFPFLFFIYFSPVIPFQ